MTYNNVLTCTLVLHRWRGYIHSFRTNHDLEAGFLVQYSLVPQRGLPRPSNSPKEKRNTSSSEIKLSTIINEL